LIITEEQLAEGMEQIDLALYDIDRFVSMNRKAM
jgi:hypothetical protein